MAMRQRADQLRQRCHVLPPGHHTIDEEVADTGGNGAVAFISREELAVLRAGNASAAAAPASGARKKAKSDSPSDYVFVGKWFLKRLAEVRDDIV